MNWSKIKNIMIGILLLINVFLLTDIALTRFMSTALPEGTGENFKSVLNRDGITIDEELIPHYYETRYNITAEFYNIDELTDIFIGESVRYVSDGQSVIAALDDKRLALSGNRFEYTTLREGVEKNGRDIIKALKSMGLMCSGAVYDPEDGVVKVVVDSVEVEGIYLDVTLAKDGTIAYAEGMWPKITVGGSSEKVSIIAATVAITDVLTNGAHIDRIDKIYAFESVDRVPTVKSAWRVYANGRSYVVS